MSSDSDPYARAGDYVMGRMEPAERERAELDLERDPQFREAVLRLSERIRRSDAISDTQLWHAVEAGLNSLPQMRMATSSQLSGAGRTKGRSSRMSSTPSHLLSGWKGAVLMAGVAAACGASYMAGDARARMGAPDMVVTLTDASGGIGGILEVGDGDMLRFLPLALPDLASGDVLQLWTIYDETIGYVPLGTLPAFEMARWRGPDLPSPRPGQRYRMTAGGGNAAAAGGAALLEGAAQPVGGR